MAVKRRGLLVVLSSPSGAGKTSLVRALMADDSSLNLSISATTRPKRPVEVDGVDYHFISEDTFKQHIENDDFLEYAKVFGNYYGTLRKPVEHNQTTGIDTLFDIDWQGTQQLSQKINLVRIFILPPSYKALEERLKQRKQDSSKTIEERMRLATGEMSHWAEYDYVIINDNFENALQNVQSIISAERLKRDRQIGLDTFVKSLYVQETETK